MARQMLLWDAVRRAQVRREPGPASGPRATSRAAAASVHHETRCDMVLSLLRGSGDRGLTCDQVSAVTGWPPNQVSPRLDQLRRAGWIVETNRRRATRSGRKAMVYVAVGRGDHAGEADHPQRRA